MRRRTRGRGSGRPARGGGSTNSRNNSTSNNPVTGPTKSTTILSAFQRQSSPYIRQIRGGLGRTIKKAINSIISDNDIMNNNTFTPTVHVNGTAEQLAGKVNGINGKLKDDTPDGYLHKKFKKVTTSEIPLNGVISVNHNNTLTISRGGEEKPSSPKLREAEPVQNGNIGLSTVASVYKPKFRISSAKIEESVTGIEKQRAGSAFTLLQEFEPKLQPQQQLTVKASSVINLSRSSTSNSYSRVSAHEESRSPNSATFPSGMLTIGNSSDKRFDRQSLDDRISKIINENQSILATWPEHLTKRSKGNSGRYSLSARPGTHSVGVGFGEVSRRESLDFTASSAESSNSSISSKPATTIERSNHRLNRSNSDMSQQLLYHDRSDLLYTSLERLNKNSDEASFTVPKKRRRLSPISGISCNELSDFPKNGIISKQDHLASTSKNLHNQKQLSETEVGMSMVPEVSNFGDSGTKLVNVQANGGVFHTLVTSHRQRVMSMQDDSSNSSSNGSSASHFSPDSRQSLIRIRKDSIFERDSLSPSPLSTVSMTLPAATGRRRGRPSKSEAKEAPKIRKVVERLQSHLNAKTAALAAMASSTSSFLQITPVSATEKSAILLAMSQTQLSMTTSLPYNHNTSKVPAANAPLDREIQGNAALLLQTTALNPKRPNFLALKPANGVSAKKRIEQLACILPSPETPRGVKNYNQMHINGNAYTYLGFKISTKSSYTCLFKPQPMFVPQETDPKLSMYSNWQPRPKDPNEDAKLKLSAYDSRVNFRKSGDPLYLAAVRNNFETLTINSPENAAVKFSVPNLSLTNFVQPSSSPTQLDKLTEEEKSKEQHKPGFHQACSPSPPPTPDSPELTIDERPLAERTSATHSPKPILIGDSSETPPIPASRPVANHSPPLRPNVETSLRYRKKSIYFCPGETFTAADGVASSSESSSADELANSHQSRTSEHRDDRLAKGRSVSLCITTDDVSLDLTKPLGVNVGGSKERHRSQSVSLSSPSAILSNLDSARVKIMDGGFESNEDYTYVRGRGRGRYVCESCGIRCKKPSMLRKHLKTHTDLRPYTCKLCNFSFKTKGNLTKHQKSKSHHKKCITLGIHPESSRSLEMIGPISDSNDEGDSEDDEEDDPDHDSDSADDMEEDDVSVSTDTGNEKEKFEKEIALSLLDLSQTSRLSEKRDQAASVGNTHERVVCLPSSSKKMPVSFSSAGGAQSMPVATGHSVEYETPMDLSVKATRGNHPDSSSKFFGGVVKSMEIVGEAQRWEPEEELLKNGCLNLKKVRNHLAEIEKQGLIKGARNESIKVEVPEPQSLTSLGTEDLHFQFEIRKQMRTSSMTNNSVSVTRVTPNASLVAVSGPSYEIEPKPNIRKRLHQPWLSPQGSMEEAVPNNIRELCEPSKINGLKCGSGSSSASVGGREEGQLHTAPENLTSLSPEGKVGGGNGVKIQLPSNGCSSLQSLAALRGIKPQAEFRQPSGAQMMDEGKAECNVCGKTFSRAGQLTLHMNIHYLERPFRCDPCGVSFRTKGHLIKHRRSSSHDCKVYLTEAWGVANEENPRPFKCGDCKIAFRIHGHLAKHLRSKMHIMRMECLGKLPFGIYFEMEKSGLNLNEIDTTDCDMSLVSLQSVAQKIYGEEWRQKLSVPIEDPV